MREANPDRSGTWARPCKFHARGLCVHGEECLFAHVRKLEVPDVPEVKLCPLVQAQCPCTKPKCKYAHSPTEIRENVRSLTRATPSGKLPETSLATHEEEETVLDSDSDDESLNQSTPTEWSRASTPEHALGVAGASSSNEPDPKQKLLADYAQIMAPYHVVERNSFLSFDAWTPLSPPRAQSMPNRILA